MIPQLSRLTTLKQRLRLDDGIHPPPISHTFEEDAILRKHRDDTKTVSTVNTKRPTTRGRANKLMRMSIYER